MHGAEYLTTIDLVCVHTCVHACMCGACVVGGLVSKCMYEYMYVTVCDYVCV